MSFLHGPWGRAGWGHLESSPLADKAPKFLRGCTCGAGGGDGDRGRGTLLVVGAGGGWVEEAEQGPVLPSPGTV